MKRVTLLVLAILSLASAVHAGDSKRKGWVSGVGLGYAPIARIGAGGDRRGVAFHALLGGAWDEQNMVVLDVNMSFTGESYRGFVHEPRTQQGFLGAGWYHYYGSRRISFFTEFALGAYYFKYTMRAANSPGLAYQIGAGLALWGHTQIGAYLANGESSYAGTDFTHTRLDLLISVIMF